MITEDLLKIAEDNVNNAQNESWRPNEENPYANAFAKMLFLDAQSRILLAIAQELKRANDNGLRINRLN
jgi:hypothetical protein